jgi:transcription initiation factor TFIIIB Brf1 subunit/transcription initiation factor TFIIB
MTSQPPSARPSPGYPQPCKHLRVQIVSRDAESEFVECKECGEIFESSEFKDMSIEERTRDES